MQLVSINDLINEVAFLIVSCYHGYCSTLPCVIILCCHGYYCEQGVSMNGDAALPITLYHACVLFFAMDTILNNAGRKYH